MDAVPIELTFLVSTQEELARCKDQAEKVMRYLTASPTGLGPIYDKVLSLQVEFQNLDEIGSILLTAQQKHFSISVACHDGVKLVEYDGHGEGINVQLQDGTKFSISRFAQEN